VLSPVTNSFLSPSGLRFPAFGFDAGSLSP
jgi:hypothetical protein